MTNKEKLDTTSIEEMEIECQKHEMCYSCKYYKAVGRYSLDICELQIKEWLESEVTNND